MIACKANAAPIKREPRAPIDLTREERGHLYFACMANGSGMGLFGPSIGRYDRVPICEALVGRQLLMRDDQRSGYWITDAGREALRQAQG